LDKDLEVEYINKERFLDYSHVEFIGKSILSFTKSENLNSKYKKINEIISSQNEFRLCLQKKNGEPEEYIASNYEFPSNPNKLLILLKELENQEPDPDEDYRFIIENLSDIISVFDENYDLIFINKAQNSISGFSKEEVLGKSPFDYLHPEDINKAANMFQKASVKGYSSGEFRMRNKSGKFVWLEVNIKRATDKKGRKRIIVSSRDIERRKQIQEELKNSEKRYLHLFDNSPFAIILIDLNGKIIEINSTTTSLTGYQKEELVGKNFQDLSLIQPSFIPPLMRRFTKLIHGQELPPIDLKLYKKNGEEIWVNFGTSYIKIGDQEFIQSIGYDISDQKKAELLIKQEIKKLRELEQMRRDIIMRVSHELKTPLISIIGGTEWIEMSLKKKKEDGIKEVLGMIERGGNRLNKLVDRLLDISKIEFGKLTLNRKKTNIKKLIKEVVRSFDFMCYEREVRISTDLPEQLFLSIDPLRIEQVISNLISNAIKNTPHEGTIYIQLEKEGRFASITVEDNGIGLTKLELKKIFKRFGKIEREGEGLEYLDTSGSGLGLFISKEIILKHGGTIFAESEGRGKGSKFILKLPIENK
jgi:PAS domain S-box-containing protein